MGIFTGMGELHEADIIIAGGNYSRRLACSARGIDETNISRLAQADPDSSIIVIEGGGNNYADPTVTDPDMFLAHLRPGSKSMTFHKARRAQALNSREPVVPAASILGGGSYCRALGSDFEAWNAEGWGKKDILPFMQKLETYHAEGNIDVHGYQGPIHVSESPFSVCNFEREILLAAEQQGYRKINDLQDLTANNGFSRWRKCISPEGKRQDTAHQYLHPLLLDGKHPNLHVILQTKVIRILFDENKRASAVECAPSESSQESLGLNQPNIKSIRARKMVIICSGALGTPPILERSGIGNPSVLQQFAIPVISSLPGVGENYQDHHLMQIPYKICLGTEEANIDFLSNGINSTLQIGGENSKPGWNAVDLSSKLRPTATEIGELGPEFQAIWDKEFKNAPEKPLVNMGIVSRYIGDISLVPDGQYATVAIYTTYPHSRGSIHITGRSMSDPPDFDTGFLSDANDIDLKTLQWAYKKQREIIRRTDAYRGEVAERHPKFREGSKAALLSLNQSEKEQGGSRLDLPTITYSQEDNEAIQQFIRENLGTTWHGLGTAKMASREARGVVDKNLSVYGILGLKCADMSVAPENVGANTCNTAMTIAEKAASIIAAELGLEI
ncbi:alcohol oxidase [Oidiodendron maius Zn]|uniref:Alcohol oxidase n=1 Tax=Oidiodendron maius (strain Zn) TaxID=913774 RepID=A0A0C3C5J5_OIDMZ|nr:alcohol oxidase [Oidiodendron maius Zn]